MRIRIRNHVQMNMSTGKNKKAFHTRAERKAVRYSQGIGLSYTSGLHLNMGTPHWGGVHKKGNEPTVFPEYRHQKEIGQDMVGLLCVFTE